MTSRLKAFALAAAMLAASRAVSPSAGGLKDAARAEEPVSGSGGHAVILQYHFFGEEYPPSTSVSIERFEDHLDAIEKADCRVWPLKKIVQRLREGDPLPDPCVAITIDDAYNSVYTGAFPLLRERGWPATVFVPTAAVDGGMGGYMSWDRIREMQREGIDFASHGHGHIYMLRRLEGESARAWEARIRKDIEVSLDRLESELGERPELFAYPYGEYNSRLKEIVEGMGLVGFGQHSGPVWQGSDFGALPRFPVSGPYSELGSFVTKLKSLPLPVKEAIPGNPGIESGDPPPVLRLKLATGDFTAESLACFVSGQGRVDIEWIDRQGLVLEAAAEKPLPEGRSRYNFTAVSREGGRYYWYSHPWFVYSKK